MRSSPVSVHLCVFLMLSVPGLCIQEWAGGVVEEGSQHRRVRVVVASLLYYYILPVSRQPVLSDSKKARLDFLSLVCSCLGDSEWLYIATWRVRGQSNVNIGGDGPRGSDPGSSPDEKNCVSVVSYP